MYDPTSCLSMPRYAENASPRCLEQTVLLPYHVPGGLPEGDLLELESLCLRVMHKKFLMRMLLGSPVKAFLLEYILGGNGGSLTDRFLIKLGRICQEFGINVIADEVLTGGRIGPHMALTPTKPKQFRENVTHITMGKFMGCALVLKKTPKKPTKMDEPLRGTSTTQDVGIAYLIYEHVVKAMNNGAVEQRQEEVLSAMRLDGLKNAHRYWGDGLLLFSEKKRPAQLKGLKNRMLPVIDVGTRVRVNRSEKSKWTREAVTSQIVETIHEWLICGDTATSKSVTSAFLSPTVDFLFVVGATLLEPEESNEVGYFRLRPEQVIEHIGKATAKKLAENMREMKQAEGAMCKASALSFARMALFLACVRSTTSGDKLVKKKRKTLKRTEYTFVHSKLFGTVNKASGEFQFYS